MSTELQVLGPSQLRSFGFSRMEVEEKLEFTLWEVWGIETTLQSHTGPEQGQNKVFPV